MLGPMLFILFVNDLPDVIKNTCKLYADDCKILATVRNAHDAAILQRDINEVIGWCDDWFMQLNFSKCRVMHCGRHNQASVYNLVNPSSGESIPLETTNRERDLGIIITSDMKWNEQVTSAVRASKMTGMLRKYFESRDQIMWKKIYTSSIRPHLEFAAAVWNPRLHSDIALLKEHRDELHEFLAGFAACRTRRDVSNWV